MGGEERERETSSASGSQGDVRSRKNKKTDQILTDCLYEDAVLLFVTLHFRPPFLKNRFPSPTSACLCVPSSVLKHFCSACKKEKRKRKNRGRVSPLVCIHGTNSTLCKKRNRSRRTDSCPCRRVQECPQLNAAGEARAITV